MTTLYVSDLDGTLLLPTRQLGDRTIAVVNEFIASGGLFTYATARSYQIAAPVTASLRLELPVITYGGAVIVDPVTGLPRDTALLPIEAVEAVLAATAVPGAPQPIVFVNYAGRDRACWLEPLRTPFIDSFLQSRQGDPRLAALDSWDEIDPHEVFTLSVIGTRSELVELRHALGASLDRCHLTLAEDVYTPDEYWLELASLAGTKAAALSSVLATAGADRLVCFGDNLNDLPMFAVADESYAVANAVPEVKQQATAVIDGNADEGVATWLAANAL